MDLLWINVVLIVLSFGCGYAVAEYKHHHHETPPEPPVILRP